MNADGSSPNENYSFINNQFTPTLNLYIPTGVTILAENNQTGSTSPTSISGNVLTPGFLAVMQPMSAPVSIESGSLAVSSPLVAKLQATSNGSTDAQLWLRSDSNSMVLSKTNAANLDSLNFNYFQGTTFIRASGSTLSGGIFQFGQCESCGLGARGSRELADDSGHWSSLHQLQRNPGQHHLRKGNSGFRRSTYQHRMEEGAYRNRTNRPPQSQQQQHQR